MVWTCRKGAKPKNAKTNRSGYNRRNKEKRKTAQKMKGRGLRGLEYNGNKKWACCGQGSLEMEENCIGSRGPQRTVAREKKKKEEKKKKVAREWIKLHNEELHNLQTLLTKSNQGRGARRNGHVAFSQS
jgi:hypothetical protein